MATRTLHRIELPSGVTLLEVGDRVEEELAPDFAQPSVRFGALGGRWASGLPLGNVERKLEWTREKNYPTNSAARYAMISEPAMVGLWDARTADITIAGVPGCHDEMVFRVFGFTLEAMVPRVQVCGTGGRILWKYSARCGEAIPVSGVLESPGLPANWSLTPAEDQEWIMEDGPPAIIDCEPSAGTPADPGAFPAEDSTPADPGTVQGAAVSDPEDPGDFVPNFEGPGVLVTGTLTPDASGFLPQIADDINGRPQFASGGIGDWPFIRLIFVVSTGTSGRWNLFYETAVNTGSQWRAEDDAEFATQPTPDLATGWIPYSTLLFGGDFPTGTPGFTFIP